jgi:choline-sulfatase
VTSTQPNILLIMADQLTPFLTGAYGHPVVKTPNLDRLVHQGVRFDAAYSSCPLCAPARASLMTGRHASGLRSYDNASAFDSEEPTIAHYLAADGYDTVASGKMHYVGPDQLHGLHRRLTTDVYPEDYDWVSDRDPHDRPSYSFARAYTCEGVSVGEWSHYLSYDEEAHFRAKEYLRARGVARQAASKKQKAPQPFFLIASYHHPHDPFWPPREFWDLYADEHIDIPEFPENLTESYSPMDRWLNHYHGCDKFLQLKDPKSLRCLRRAYYALVSYVDHKVGELLQTLEESGLDEDTFVIFLSDHGDMLGEKGMVQKRNFYERSSRIPFIVRFPNRQHAGMVVRQPTSLVDVLPTVLEMANVREHLPVDGHSVMVLIDGWDSAERHAFSEYHSNGVYSTCFMVRRGDFKYIHIQGHQDQLFDLKNDPGEWQNLAGQLRTADVERELKALILETFDPAAIEQEVRATIRKRKLFKRWGEATGVQWAYSPEFDACKNAVAQYLPTGNTNSVPPGAAGLWENESDL